ncbi:MAG: hypothetical protein HOV92_12695 [Streptomyces sp.]|nr:hypothetical protein [Streptomyces sp.]
MRYTITAVTAALLLALTACGTSSDGNGKPAAKPTPSADPAGQFIAATQDLAFTTMRPSNDELLAFPPKWCAGLADGHSVQWLFSGGGGGLYPSGMQWGMVKREANQLLVAGVKAYCPKHLNTVQAELRAAGEY